MIAVVTGPRWSSFYEGKWGLIVGGRLVSRSHSKIDRQTDRPTVVNEWQRAKANKRRRWEPRGRGETHVLFIIIRIIPRRRSALVCVSTCPCVWQRFKVKKEEEKKRWIIARTAVSLLWDVSCHRHIDALQSTAHCVAVFSNYLSWSRMVL